LGYPVIEPSVLSVKPDGSCVKQEKVAVAEDPLLSITDGAAIEADEPCVKVKDEAE
jgi:hypothetical protein